MIELHDKKIDAYYLFELFKQKQNFLKFVKKKLLIFKIEFKDLMFFIDSKMSGCVIYANYEKFSIFISITEKWLSVEDKISKHLFKCDVRRRHFLKNKTFGQIQHGYQNKTTCKYFMYMNIKLR